MEDESKVECVPELAHFVVIQMEVQQEEAHLKDIKEEPTDEAPTK